MLMETPEQKTQADSAMADAASKFQAEMRVYEKTITVPRDREWFEKIALPLEQFDRAWARIQPLSRESKQKEAGALWMAEGLPAAVATSKALEDLGDFNETNGGALVALAVEAGAAARFWTLMI